jgi:hypothetical protein
MIKPKETYSKIKKKRRNLLMRGQNLKLAIKNENNT